MHKGFTQCKSAYLKLKERVWWSSLGADANAWVKPCHTCSIVLHIQRYAAHATAGYTLRIVVQIQDYGTLSTVCNTFTGPEHIQHDGTHSITCCASTNIFCIQYNITDATLDYTLTFGNKAMRVMHEKPGSSQGGHLQIEQVRCQV